MTCAHAHMPTRARTRALAIPPAPNFSSSFADSDCLLLLLLKEMSECEVKQVLVTYGDRKKVLKITPNSGLTDVEVLTKSFRTEFKFETNVNVVVTFQRFDPDWDETVDLECESVIKDKDKLIAVVTPLLVTPTISSPAQSYLDKVSADVAI